METEKMPFAIPAPMVFVDMKSDTEAAGTTRPSRPRTTLALVIWRLLLCSLGLWGVFRLALVYHPVFGSIVESFGRGSGSETFAGVCPQVDAVVPSNVDLLDLVYEDFGDAVFINKSAELLGAAIRIETESFDDLGPIGEDERWEKYAGFHEFLEGAFPHIHKTLKREKVNTWGLVYTWEGSESSFKPLLLAAHQDTVPVDRKTLDLWIQPPFSGFFDGEYIWGRGSCDDKEQVVGAMIAVETLVRHGFRPKRTIILAFGFDEEISGLKGARCIGQFLLERYGPSGIEMIMDEGSGYGDLMGRVIAAPGVGERGHVDIKVQVNTAGGHSSVPPRNTGIDILSSLVHTLNRNPPAPKLTRTNPFYGTLQCMALYSPNLPRHVKKDLALSRKSDKALRRVVDWASTLPSGPLSPVGGSLLRTTQASTLIQGGVKVNALPEQAYAVINHRIVVGSSVEEVHSHYTGLLTPEAKEYNLSLTAFGDEILSKSGKAGELYLTEAFSVGLEPAPITPEGPVWELFSGTIKAEYARRGLQGDAADIAVAPGVMNVNTDTRHYWVLTENIFRYAHLDPAGMYNGLHTINEAITIDNFMGHVRFVTLLVLNMDEADL